jgi:hypothetical protein
MREKPFDPSKPVIVAGPVPPPPSNSSRNAMKHGCCASNTLLLPTESEEDLKALEAIWLKTYNPSSEAERHLVQELAHADWFLQRATRTYNDVESGLFAANPNPAEWTEAQDRKLGRFLRYKTAHTNNVIRCQKRVEDFRKARLAEKSLTQKTELAQVKMKQAQNKTPSGMPLDWNQHLKNMRDEAVARGFVSPDEPNPFANR